MIRKSSISLAVVLILLGMNLALITTSSVIPTSELNSQNDGDLLLKDTWDFGVGGRYQPGSAHIDSNEKVIVILAETSDVKMSHSKSYFEDMLFGQEYGSMRHYFSEATHGYTDMTGVVVGPVRLPNTLVYYDPGDEENIWEAIEDAISIADSSINFSPYDQDGDGLVDNFMIIFAGESDSSNGDADGDGENEDAGAIWPHKWSLGSTYNTNDGVGVSKYFTCAEECRMGTFAHEISHNFGLPDLYDSEDYSSEGIGEWGLMGSGNHLRTSSGTPNPAHLSAWSKQELGLLEPTEVGISTSQTYTLRAASTHADALKIPITSSEYFLIEFRSNTASDYDAGLHSTGILIWHIDEDICASVHSVNGDESHPCVRLIQADGDDDLGHARNRGDAADTWQSERSFNPNSIPPSRSYSLEYVPLQMTITSISSTSATVHFGSFTAWFYSISAEVQDSNGDGFNNEILFTYDPDTDGTEQDIMVQFDFYGADKTGTPTSFYDNETIEGDDYDSFEYNIGYYNGFSNGLWWIEVRLWIDDDMTDLKVFGNIWIEYPATSNSNDEWLDSVDWSTQDTTGDGFNDSLVVDFETVSAQSWGGTGDAYLEIYSDEDVSYEARHSEYRTSLDWGSHSIILDMSETDLEPGILRGNLILYVDSQREHIASALNLDLWWDSVRLENPMATAHDLDEDGAFDSIEVSVDIDHSLRTDTPVLFEINAWNMSEFTGFTSMKESRSIPLGPMSEGSSGGRGEQSFWLYAEWEQDVIIEVRAVLPNGNEFIEMIYWDEYNDEYGFSLQPLDWPVTAWQTNIQLLDSNSDGQQDLFRVQYDLDSVSPALDVAVELEVRTPDGSTFSVWDNYTIEGDAYDIRILNFSTWLVGSHEFTLRVHDLEDGEVEYEESLGTHQLSSAFDAPSLHLTRSDLGVYRGSYCSIIANLSDLVGDYFDLRGRLEWDGIPFIPASESLELDCSQWPDGVYDVSGSYTNGLGLAVTDEVRIMMITPVVPILSLDDSGVGQVEGEPCTILAQASVVSEWSQLEIERIEWTIGDQTPVQGSSYDCSSLPAGLTTIKVIAYATGGTSTSIDMSVVMAPESPASAEQNGIELSPKDDLETESWGVILTAVMVVVALIVPFLFVRFLMRKESDEEDELWDPESEAGYDFDPIAAPVQSMPPSMAVVAPPPHAPQFEEFQDEAGWWWRRYADGRLDYYDEPSDFWLPFKD